MSEHLRFQLLNKHSVPLLDIVVAFTAGFIVGKVAGHLNDLYLKKKKFSGKL